MKRIICFFVVVCLLVFVCPASEPATRPASVNLLAMGDWGRNDAMQRKVAATMGKHITAERASNRKFDAMLLAGDNFYVKLDGGINDPKWKTMFEDLYEPAVFDFPFYPALGNHDYQEGKYKIELEYSKANPQSRWKMPARWYRVDLPDEKNPLVTVLVLDSYKDGLGEEEWDRELTWLSEELAKPRTAKWVVGIAHHPLISNGDHGDNGPLARSWGRLFNQAGVDFFIAGHDHDLQHLEYDAFKPSLLLVGGGGATTRPIRVDQRGPFSKSINGFADLEFTDRRARVRLINGNDGTTLHDFTPMPDGHVSVIESVPSDVAKPRTVKSITRGGEDTPATQKSKEKDD